MIGYYRLYHNDLNIYQTIDLINDIQDGDFEIVGSDSTWVYIKGDLKNFLLFLARR